MANYLLKSDSFGLEPAEFEDLSEDPTRVLRAYKHGRKSNKEVSQHPLAKNLIRHDDAQHQPEPVEVCVSPLFDPESEANDTTEKEPEEKAVEPEELAEMKQQWDQLWQAKLDDAVEKARTEAYGRGFAEAKEALSQEIQAEKVVLAETVTNLKNTWESFINRSETLLLEIAIEIAQFLLNAPLPEHLSKTTETALLEALEVLSREVPIRLSLNPVDFLRLQESGLTKNLEDQFTTLRWDPQPTLKEGNWIIQTPRQAIRRVSEELLDNLRDRFGLNEQTQQDLVLQQKPATFEGQQIPPVNNIAVTTTMMGSQQKMDLSTSMSFSTATSTAAQAASLPDSSKEGPAKA